MNSYQLLQIKLDFLDHIYKKTKTIEFSYSISLYKNYNMKVIENNELDPVFVQGEKYNTSLKLKGSDATNPKLKILCNEDYAQEFYDILHAYESSSGISENTSKDLVEGNVYDVRATQISFDDKFIYTQEINSGVEIAIPFKEYANSLEELSKGDNLLFNVMISKSDKHGMFIGSQKKCMAINYSKELTDHFNNETWFEVSIKKLIKGGYVAMYKDTIECFIPGSHAGANVIRDFSKLLGSKRNVMVDNYDKSNNLFILSYKKYIDKSMPVMISELKFGHKYTGTLTTKPYDFGIFVEFEGYYTGLIHNSEFENYNEARLKFKTGDEIDFYIKNVTQKGDKYRVVLTLNKDEIDSEKLRWDKLRNQTENKTFEYDVDRNKNSMKIYVEGESYDVSLRHNDLQRDLKQYPKVKVSKVDPINKSLKFEFVENI